MPTLDKYIDPQSAEWLKMVGQASMVPPDQAQINQSLMENQPPMSIALPPVPVSQDPKEIPMSMGPATPPKISDVPMVQNFQPGQGLAAYMSPATKAMDRSIIDQYREQAKQAMNEQQSGIDQLQQYRDDFAKKDLPVDWTHLGGLVDLMNGQNGQKTNMADQMAKTRGLTAEQKDDKLLKLQEYIQQAKGGMSKEKLQALQQTLAMVHQNDQANLMAQHYANEERSSQTRSDAFADRNKLTMDAQGKAIADAWDKDPIMKPQVDRLNQIKLDRHTLESGGVINAQVMDEIANGIATALAGGKAAGFHATELQQIKDLGKDLAAKRSYFEGKQYNALSDDNKQFLNKLLVRLEGGYGNAIGRRAKELYAGRNYPHNPVAQQVNQDKFNHYSSAYTPEPDSEQSAPEADPVKAEYDRLVKEGKIK